LVQRVNRGNPNDDDAYQAAYQGLLQATRALNGLYSRVAIRLPENSELPKAVKASREKLGMLRIYAGVDVWPTSTKVGREELARTLDEVAESIETLEAEARKVAQSELLE
jgi:uncharacterized protein YukE